VLEAPRVVASQECPWFTVVLRTDGILAYYPIRGLVLTHPIALQVIRLGSAIANGPKPTLVLMEDMARVDRDARECLASEAYMRVCSQTALVVGSPVSRVIGNFFLGLNRPKYPLRLFDAQEPATAWLLGFGSTSA
jgi:hypothetical protein